jgi:hypothetical protein
MNIYETKISSKAMIILCGYTINYFKSVKMYLRRT